MVNGGPDPIIFKLLIATNQSNRIGTVLSLDAIFAIDEVSSNDVTIKGFDINAADTPNAAISIAGAERANDNIFILDNRIHDAPGAGIDVGSHNTSIYIDGNHIYANAEDGISFPGSNGDHYFILGNLIEDNGWNGIDIGARRSFLIQENTIVNNETRQDPIRGYSVSSAVSAENVVKRGVTLAGNLIVRNNGDDSEDGTSRDLGAHDQMLDDLDRDNRTTCGCERPQQRSDVGSG